MSNYPRSSETYALILIHPDGQQVVFESGISKERAEEMQGILRGFITDVQVVDQDLPVKPAATNPDAPSESN